MSKKYNRVRLTPELRQLQILNAAISVALKTGLYNVTLANVSRSIDDSQCSKATIKHYFTMEQLRSAVIVKAMQEDHDVIVAQAITMKHKTVSNLNKQERKRYLNNV